MSAPILGADPPSYVLSNGTDTGVNTMVKHVLPAGVGMESLRLRFGNWAVGTGGEADGTSTVTVVCSVGPTATGPWYPVRRSGSRILVLEGGANIETDPIAARVTPGGTFYSKTFLSVTAAGIWAAVIPIGAIATNYWCSQSNGETDLSQSTAAFTPSGGSKPYAPLAVIADFQPSTLAKVAIIGDSISGGTGDTVNNTGFAYRALQGFLPYCRIATSGTRATNLIDPNVGRRRLETIRGCNVANVMYGINDIQFARTQAQLEADLVLLWTILTNMGMRVFADTLLPYTTSTDLWVTLVNQTPPSAGKETIRVAVNDWIRDGAPILAGMPVATGSNAGGTLRAGAVGHPLTAYFETADQVESARNSGLWKVNGAANYATADGLHPSAVMHTALAGVLTPATFIAAVAL